MSPRRDSRAGFSVVEALVSMALFMFVLLAVMTTYAPNREIHASGERKVDVQQNARLAVSEMTREIRMAGYFPENFADPPASPALASPIRLATDDVLAIYGETDGSGASTVVLYCLDGDRVRKGRAAVDQVAAYTCSSGEILAEGATALQFLYYDDDGNPIPAPPTAPFALDGEDVGAVPDTGDTTERDNVRKVVVTLTTMDELPHRGQLFYALTSEVTLRNGS